jgi:hypothetical protein
VRVAYPEILRLLAIGFVGSPYLLGSFIFGKEITFYLKTNISSIEIILKKRN